MDARHCLDFLLRMSLSESLVDLIHCQNIWMRLAWLYDDEQICGCKTLHAFFWHRRIWCLQEIVWISDWGLVDGFKTLPDSVMNDELVDIAWLLNWQWVNECLQIGRSWWMRDIIFTIWLRKNWWVPDIAWPRFSETSEVKYTRLDQISIKVCSKTRSK